MTLNPTPEQQQLIEVIQAKDLKAIAIEAGPGCGKSSTLVLLSSYITDKGQMTCFGADIRKELNAKLQDSPFDAKTFNSIGWSTIRKELKKRIGRQPSFEEMKTDEAKYKKIADKAIQGDYFNDYGIPALLIPDGVRYDAINFIERLAYFSMVTMTNNSDMQGLARLITTYEFTPRIDIDDDSKAEAIEEDIKDWGLDNLPAFMSIGEKVIESELWMTFTDQVYYTVKWNLRPWQTKYLFIDEAQDISEMELRLLSQCVRSGGYVVVVGDPHQSIMNFKGAMPGSFGRVVSYFKAETFPLSATFRCPRRVVRLANMVKPELQAFFDKEGTIELKDPDTLIDIVQERIGGDVAIIARTTAPLVRMCLDLIDNDIAATVLGRNIGEQLNQVLDKIAQTDGFTFNGLLDALKTYRKINVARMTKKMTDENEIKAYTDTLDTLKVIIERHTNGLHKTPATSLDELKQRINDLFSDPKDAGDNIIKLMTAHKSKGMEFETVILYNDFRVGKKPGENRVTAMPIDETYVWFVAVTRTKNELIVLDGKQPEWLLGHLPGHAGYALPPFTPPSIAPKDDAEVVEEAPEPDTPEPAEPAPVLSKPAQIARDWAVKLLDEKNFVVLDTETTDLDGEIVQLAVCDHEGNALINTLIKPVKYPISKGAQAVHGISDEMVNDAPTLTDVYPTLAEVIKDKTVVAYNVEFDCDRVRTSTQANNLPLIAHLPSLWTCAMKTYSRYNPDKITSWGKPGGWWKLKEAIEQEGIDTSDVEFHSALFDVRATLAVMQSMAGVAVTAFAGKNDPLPFKETEWGTFKQGEKVFIIPTGRTGTIHAYLSFGCKYSVHVDYDSTKGRFATYSEAQLKTLYLYDAPIGPEPQPKPAEESLKVDDPITFNKGDRVHIKSINKQGTVFAVSDLLVSVKVDDAGYMAYNINELSLIASPADPEPIAQTTAIIVKPTPAPVAPIPIRIVPKPKLPARVRKQVQTMLDTDAVTVDHIDEIIGLLQEMRVAKLAKTGATS